MYNVSKPLHYKKVSQLLNSETETFQRNTQYISANGKKQNMRTIVKTIKTVFFASNKRKVYVTKHTCSADAQ